MYNAVKYNRYPSPEVSFQLRNEHVRQNPPDLTSSELSLDELPVDEYAYDGSRVYLDIDVLRQFKPKASYVQSRSSKLRKFCQWFYKRLLKRRGRDRTQWRGASGLENSWDIKYKTFEFS